MATAPGSSRDRHVSEREARAAAKVLVIVDRKKGRQSSKLLSEFAAGKEATRGAAAKPATS